MKSLSSSSIVF